MDDAWEEASLNHGRLQLGLLRTKKRSIEVLELSKALKFHWTVFPYVWTKGVLDDLVQQKDARELLDKLLLIDIIECENLENLLASIIDKRVQNTKKQYDANKLSRNKRKNKNKVGGFESLRGEQ